MHWVSIRALTALVLLLACACSDDASGDADAGGAGAAAASGGGSGGSGGADGGAPSGGSSGFDAGPPPPPFTLTAADLPADWERPADCGGIGELCWDCGDRGVCQLLTNTCVASDRINDVANNRRSNETPYCEAYACMDFEEASCYCTGPAGEMTPECQDGPAGLAGLCTPQGGSCAEDAGSCCGSLECLTWGPSQASCYQRCETADDCDTGCCTDLRDTGDMVCAPASECETPCKRQGEDCESASECCRGSCNANDEVPEWNGCRARCLTDTDCESECCIPYNNQDYGFCADADWCACQPVGSPCGPGIRGCCEEQFCLSDTPTADTFSCRGFCTSADDCDTGCCIGVTGADEMACVDASFCQ